MSQTASAGLDDVLPVYNRRDFDLGQKAPLCDLVMKGGVTSGVVYPYAILKIATHYRLKSVGGTSAGAIAAAFAAAAEYARSCDDPEGFVRLQERCNELPERLFSLFQPSPDYQELWGLVTYVLDGKKRPRSGGGTGGKFAELSSLIVPQLLVPVVLGALAGIVIAIALATIGALAGFIGIGLVGGGLVLVGAVAGAAFKLALITGIVAGALGRLPTTNFGLCPGIRQRRNWFKGAGTEGITDWIEESLNYIAFGRNDPGRPLLFGDLRSGKTPIGLQVPRMAKGAKPEIDLQTVTTNLSANRPHTFPDPGLSMWFCPDQWSRVFPARTMKWLLEQSGPALWDLNETPVPRDAATCGCDRERQADACRRDLPKTLVKLPFKETLPVAVGVRASLSFPILFEAIPVYARELRPKLTRKCEGVVGEGAKCTTETCCGKCPKLSYTLRENPLATPGRGRGRKDASDREAPNADTLNRFLLSDGGISSNFPTHMFDSPLPSHPTFGFNLAALPERADESTQRVQLPTEAADGFYLQANPIGGLMQFASAILGSAKDWQDRLQWELTGQRERTVHIYLSKDQGGLNLNMPPELSRQLMKLGSEAGACFVAGGGFDFDEHRWRRALATFKGMSDYLNKAADSWTHNRYARLMASRDPNSGGSYPPLAEERNRSGMVAWFSAIFERVIERQNQKPLDADGIKALPRRAGKVVTRATY